MNTIKDLSLAHGQGTSLITLLVPKSGNLWLVRKKIIGEMGTAKNIKDRVNRQSVKSALKSCLEKLKFYKKLPDVGLCILSGSYV